MGAEVAPDGSQHLRVVIDREDHWFRHVDAPPGSFIASVETNAERSRSLLASG
jgi:hypothetical protein